MNNWKARRQGFMRFEFVCAFSASELEHIFEITEDFDH